MATVIFYSFILLSSTFFVRLSERGRTKFDRWVLLGIAFLLVFIPAAIRYDIGTDFLSYVGIFNNKALLEDYKYKEPAFYFVNWLFGSFGLSAQWAIATFAFLFTAVAFKSYPRKNAWLLHFLFFSMLWLFSLSGMRQAVALSFCMLALFYYFEKRYVWFLALAALGSLFHQSAIIIVFIGGLSLVPLPQYLKESIFPKAFIITILCSYLLIDVIVHYSEFFLNLIGLTKYASYFGGRYFIERQSGTGLAALVEIAISIFVLFNAKFLLQENKRYWLVICIVFAYAISVVLAMNIVIFGRAATAFAFIMPVAIFLLFRSQYNKKLNQLLIFLFLVFYLMTFAKDSIGIKHPGYDPKLNPYQTIIEANVK